MALDKHYESDKDPKHHVTGLTTYFVIFGALMVLTVITVVISQFDFGFLNTAIALAVAALKASLVILYFMHVRHATRLTWVVVIGSFVWLGVLFVLTYSDYFSRHVPLS